MNTFIFPLWLRSNNAVCVDARIFADDVQQAVAVLHKDGAGGVWIIGDCRYSCAGRAE